MDPSPPIHCVKSHGLTAKYTINTHHLTAYTHTMQRITYSEKKMRARKASEGTEKSKQEDKMGAMPLVNRVIK